jgi:nucleoside-diphosphate-sugar epimerase
MQKKLVIYGGNGFVGSHIAQKALKANWKVVIACRSGRPVNEKEPWVQQVKWVSSDALDRPGVYSVLNEHSDAEAVISCVGVLTRNHKMAKRVNGDANSNIAAAVYESKTIRRMVLVSAAVIWPPSYFLSGYYEGKRRAILAMRDGLGDRGVTLLPGMVYGPRFFKGIYLPLNAIGVPLGLVSRPIHSLTGWSLFTPPIHVDTLAEAAVYAAANASVTGAHDYQGMLNLSEGYQSQLK